MKHNMSPSLCLVGGISINTLWVKCDSQLVVNQVKEEYHVKGERMKKYLTEARTLIEGIKKL